ncbi:hypothetical protein MAPG_00322 [Magnaporthiopsis poae ATCC 64411]|uniref:Uncharacterized protein n=1 Tax=Magnaporthiopsis poae (strain ATCC 64411 / 73-15) TaxID=644358 RepID=A0A0C4DKP4_MAGP6|nr:hypothetical protein MAPG_00322 [Magnaporthiopsis poae ATCC 64411]
MVSSERDQYRVYAMSLPSSLSRRREPFPIHDIPSGFCAQVRRHGTTIHPPPHPHPHPSSPPKAKKASETKRRGRAQILYPAAAVMDALSLPPVRARASGGVPQFLDSDMRHVSQAQHSVLLYFPLTKEPKQATARRGGHCSRRRAKRVRLTDHGPRFFDWVGLLRIHHRPTGPGGIDHPEWRRRGARARARRRREGSEKRKAKEPAIITRDGLGKRRTETQAKKSREHQGRCRVVPWSQSLHWPLLALTLVAFVRMGTAGGALFLGPLFFFNSYFSFFSARFIPIGHGEICRRFALLAESPHFAHLAPPGP